MNKELETEKNIKRIIYELSLSEEELDEEELDEEVLDLLDELNLD